MKNDCARKVLLEVEKIKFGETLTVANLQEIISEFTMEEVLLAVTLLNKEHFIIILDKASYDDSDVLRDNKIKCLTEKGFRALDSIREDDDWNLIKEKIENFDKLSFFSIINIATKIMNVKYNRIFELPDNITYDYNRW